MGKSPPGFMKERRAWLGVNVLREHNAKSYIKVGRAPREVVKSQPEIRPTMETRRCLDTGIGTADVILVC